MICKNCGFTNAAGDQFCGSCGKYLDWQGGAAAAEADGSAAAASQPDGAGEETRLARSGTPEPDPDEVTRPFPTQGPGTAAAAGAGAGVICWNCGRQNPVTRSFCQQCGERLNAGAARAGSAAAAGAGAAGAGAAGAALARSGGPPRNRGRGPADRGADDGGRRLLVVGLALIGLLLLAGGAAALFLGANAPVASPSPTTVALPSVSFEPSPSQALSPSITASPTASASPSPSPTAPPTASPTAPPTASPTAPRTPRPTRRPPTPSPTPVHCDDSTTASRFMTLSADDPSHSINPGRAWCVHQLIFIAQGGEGLLKLYLTNPIFVEQGYGSARIGWHEASMPSNFSEGPEYMPPLDVIQPYRLLPPGTLIEFEITCSAATPDCSGLVQLGYDRLSAP